MSYSPTTWVDFPSTATPITAARLNNMEDGIENSLSRGPAAAVSGTGPGSAGNLSAFYEVNITSDDIAQLTNTTPSYGGLESFGTVNGLQITHHYGGSSLRGVRNGLFVNSLFDGGATSASNDNRFYVALQTQWLGINDDGGSSGDYQGVGVGAGFVAELQSAATYFDAVCAAEFDVLVGANTNCRYISGIQIVGNLMAHADLHEGAICISGLDATAGHFGFNTGILVGAMNGAAALTSSATLVKVTDHAALTNAFDFTTTNFSGFLIKTLNGFEIRAPSGDHVIELGRIDSASSTPQIRFHCGSTTTGWDVLFLATGGTGTNGQGFLNIQTSQQEILGQHTSVAPLSSNAKSGQTAEIALFRVNSVTLAAVNKSGGVVPGDGSTTGGALYSGSGAPAGGLGANGDYFFRTDTPGTVNQRIYVKAAGAWGGIV